MSHSPGSERYWSTLDEDDDESDEGAERTVRDRIVEQIDGEIHGLSVTAHRSGTTYAVVSASTEQHGGEIVDLRTVVIDEDAETVKVSDNALWIPREPETLEGLTQIVARTTTDVVNDEPIGDPAIVSIDEVDVEQLLDREIGDHYSPDDGDDEDDGDLSPAQGEPPSEVEILDERLTDAGIGTDERYIRLRFGGKDPWSHTKGDVEYLVENYGVYATSDDPLVLVDVDEPANLDVEIPETFTVSSPHGGDDRAHYYLAVEGYEQIPDRFGKWNLSPTWGDVRVANQYVVGPGSELDECDKDGHDCSLPGEGTYEILDDREIATISVEDLVDLLADDPNVDVLEDDPEPEDEQIEDDEDDPEPEFVTCHRCGMTLPKSDASVLARDGETVVYVHAGGCPS